MPPPLLAIVGGCQQSLHDGRERDRIRPGIAVERCDLLRGGGQSRQVERRAPDQGAAVGRRRGVQLDRIQLLGDQHVDWIAIAVSQPSGVIAPQRLIGPQVRRIVGTVRPLRVQSTARTDSHTVRCAGLLPLHALRRQQDGRSECDAYQAECAELPIVDHAECH